MALHPLQDNTLIVKGSLTAQGMKLEAENVTLILQDVEMVSYIAGG